MDTGAQQHSLLTRWRLLSVFILFLFLFSSNVSYLAASDERVSIQTQDESQATIAPGAFQNTPDEYRAYFPLVSKPHRVTPTFAWTATSTGTPTEAFSPNQAIRLYVKGTSTSTESLPASFTWKISGPCGSYTLPSGTVELPGSTWTTSVDWSTPNCPGVYYYTVEAQPNHLNQTTYGHFAVNNPSIVTPFSSQFFDKCTVESVAKMKKWWDSSPYYGTNLYIGGISRACDYGLLDAPWVTQVAAQGWKFILTWVGPQAPCSSLKYKLSVYPSVAEQQGRSEAEKAVNAAVELGIFGSQVIYYDMEAYSTSNTTCHNAVNAFLTGWTNRLHQLGYKAGAYGIASNVANWYPGIDDVWIARWTSTAYNPYEGVYNLLPYISDDKWFGHRLRQYTGGHKEKWSDVEFIIDSNAAHGSVTAIPQGIVSGQSSSAVVDFQVLDNGEGFVIQDNRLLWTSDSGKSWKDLTPPSGKALLAGYFFDHAHGWVAALDQKDDSLSVLETLDGGNSWSEVLLPSLNSFPGSPVSLGFTDPQNGWLAVTLATGSNFSLGVIYRTTDGGMSWIQNELPAGGEVVFSSAETGWLAGGPESSELYRTNDGGATWELVQLSGENTLVSLPVFSSSQHGTLAVTVNDPERPRLDIYSTADGNAWTLTASQPLDPETAPSTPVQLALNEAGKAVLSLTEAGVNFVEKAPDLTIIGGKAGHPEGIVKMEFSGNAGWVYTSNGVCTGEKGQPGFNCSLQSGLFQTTDGGISWEEITP